jgi:hypothetical protein
VPSAALHPVGQVDKLNDHTNHVGTAASTKAFHLAVVNASHCVAFNQLKAAYDAQKSDIISIETIDSLNILLKFIFLIYFNISILRVLLKK